LVFGKVGFEALTPQAHCVTWAIGSV